MDVPVYREPCPSCGFVFWVPTSFHNTRREDHKTFYCPSCKGTIYYPDKTDAEKCEAENVRLKRQLKLSRDYANCSERRRISQKGATTKLRQRLDEIKEAQ